MKALLLLLLASAPAAAQSRYDDLALFRADVDRAFARVKREAALPQVVLQFSDTDSEAWCRSGAGQLQAGYGTDADTVFVCAKLRNFVTNYEELYFVIGHELGHLHHRYQERLLAKAQELLDAYKARNPPPRPDQVSEMMAYNQRGMREVGARLDVFSVEQEQLADDFSVGLMRRAGLHPGHGVLVLQRGAAFESQDANVGRIVRQRTDRILKALPKRLLDHLPRDPFGK